MINSELIVLFDQATKLRRVLKMPLKIFFSLDVPRFGPGGKLSARAHQSAIVSRDCARAPAGRGSARDSLGRALFLLPPVVSCEHLQTHLSLSASFVLKSLPGCPMLLILPAVPL